MRRHGKKTPDASPVLIAARALLAAELGRAGPSPDWAALAATAETERLSAWLYALGRRNAVPAVRLEPFRRAWLAFHRQHLAALHELERLVEAFEQAAIPVIPLKGPLLAEALYRDPGGRPFTDLDLLVPPTHAEPAVELLSGLGYRHLGYERTLAHERAHAGAACFVPPPSDPDRMPVDLHWSLLSFPGGFAPRGIDHPGVWQRASETATLGRRVLQLADDDLALYLALHLAVHHPLTGLRWRLELAVFIGRRGDRVNWQALARRARACGVSGALYFGLVATAGSLGVMPPPETVRSLRPSGWRGTLLDRLAAGAAERPQLEYLVNFASLDRLADRLRLLRAALAPSAAWVRTRYEAPSALRGWRRHYGRALKVLARR